MTDTWPSKTSAPAEGNTQAMPQVPPIEPNPELRSDLVESDKSIREFVRELRELDRKDGTAA